MEDNECIMLVFIVDVIMMECCRRDLFWKVFIIEMFFKFDKICKGKLYDVVYEILEFLVRFVCVGRVNVWLFSEDG